MHPDRPTGLPRLRSPTVAFVGTFAARLAAPVQAKLDVACDVLVGDEGEIAPRLAGVDVLVTLTFSREMGRAASRLRLVQVPGAGLDRIDRSALPRGVWLANAYGHEVGIAEYVLGAMLALTREYGRLDASLRRGEWASQWAVDVAPPPPWPELAAKTLGILGYGRIGQCLTPRALALGMTVLGIRRDPSQTASHGALVRGTDALRDVLTRADYLAITLPLTPDTRGLLGETELAAMKRTAVLVNVSRAEIVDEDALYEALAAGTIRAAAIDVWYRYPSGPEPTPPARRAFHELPNVLMTPHVSGWTEGMLEARARLIAENIGRVARGEIPVNLVPPIE